MRELNVAEITGAIAKLCIDANYYLPEDVRNALFHAMDTEESELGREIITDIIKNAEIAATKQVPICQDTGLAVVFVDLGQDVHLVGGDLNVAIDEGVRQGYEEGYLRKSTVDDPFLVRKNVGDNTPAIVHLRIVPGEEVKITFAPKGGGSENMSALAMLTAADGAEGIMKFIVDSIEKAGSNPCPPIVVGVGIGGTIEKVTLMAKQALLRTIGEHHPNPVVADMEKELLVRINDLGIGPQGFGGRTTALAVHIETFPAHIASMPVAMNLQCHVARHKEITL